MERGDRAVATFLAPAPLGAGGSVSLGEGAAHHARVRRLAEGDPVRLTDGAGTTAHGVILRVAKDDLSVRVRETMTQPQQPPVTLLVPVGDRDRMLWLAEKSVELGIAVWQPVTYARSRSVAPRGEGAGFAARVRLRMQGALEQSGGAWLPELREEIPAGRAAELEAATRLLLDADGGPILAAPIVEPVAIAFGPEGGMEPAERAAFIDRGWCAASIGAATLRFETAGIAAIAIARAVLDHSPEE